jgi:glucokinase
MLAGSVIALDVGGTTIKGAVLDSTGTALAEASWPTGRDRGPDAVVDAILAALGELQGHPAAHDAQAVGLVVPGVVDTRTGYAVWSENLCWRDVPLRDLAARRTGLPVAFGHDVRTGGLAETRVGAGRGAANVLFVPIGTGIAAAIVMDGRVLEADGYAGEIGHLDVGHGEACACGGRGCLEAIASAAAVARRYEARSGEAVHGSAGVVTAMLAGDAIAAEVWREAVEALASALAAAVALLAPERIVLGGGLSLAGDVLVGPLAAELERRLTFHRRPEFVLATLGDRSGCLGAALLARDLLVSQNPPRAV